jgi:transposase
LFGIDRTLWDRSSAPREDAGGFDRTMGVAAAATPALSLPDDVRKFVGQLARGLRVPHRLVRRAQIIELAAAGVSTYAIARQVGCSESMVRKWRGRMTADPRGPALEDAPRSGRPATISLAVRLAVLRLGCDVPPDGERRRRFREVWTISSLRDAVAAETGVRMSNSEVHSILRCGGLSPHRVVGWLHSPDPEFAARSQRIADLYVSPPAGAHVLSVDEKTGIQATRRVHPNHVGPHGHLRREFEYERRGTTTMIAALNVRTGRVHSVSKRRTRANFLRFLDELVAEYPLGDIYFVLDNLNIHKGPEVEAWAAQHGTRIHFVYTPKHASWVNQIEIWFSILQRRVLRYGSFSGVRELETRLAAFVRYYNRFEAKPFRWRFRGQLRRPAVRPDALIALAA